MPNPYTADAVSRYRTLGADPPFGDLRRAHGVANGGQARTYFSSFGTSRHAR